MISSNHTVQLFVIGVHMEYFSREIISVMKYFVTAEQITVNNNLELAENWL